MKLDIANAQVLGLDIFSRRIFSLAQTPLLAKVRHLEKVSGLFTPIMASWKSSEINLCKYIYERTIHQNCALARPLSAFIHCLLRVEVPKKNTLSFKSPC
jgi:hypothetical protein